MSDNDLSPEEKMRKLPGKLLGVFLFASGGLLLFMNHLYRVFAESQIRGGDSIGVVMLILGIAALFLVPKKIILGDLLDNRRGFFLLVWAESTTILKTLWIIVFGLCAIAFFIFL